MNPNMLDQAIGELRGFAVALRRSRQPITADQLDAVLDELMKLRGVSECWMDLGSKLASFAVLYLQRDFSNPDDDDEAKRLLEYYDYLVHQSQP